MKEAIADIEQIALDRVQAEFDKTNAEVITRIQLPRESPAIGCTSGNVE